MFYVLLFFSSILGLFVGSFLNVIIYRYNTALSPLKGRSKCFVCNKELSWYELVPILSFVIQKGKCRSCGSPISIQYPIVEIISAILFALVFIRQYLLYPIYAVYPHGLLYSVLFSIFYFFIISILLIIAVYDLKHKIIPDSLVYLFIGLSVFKLLVFSFFCLSSFGVSAFSFPYIYDLLSPIILFVPFAFLWLISGGQWIGFGDAKLALGIGALLGFVYGLSAIVLGFWIGAGFCLILLFTQHFFPGLFEHLHGKSEIPLAPFLIAGIFIVLFAHVDVLGIGGYFTT